MSTHDSTSTPDFAAQLDSLLRQEAARLASARPSRRQIRRAGFGGTIAVLAGAAVLAITLRTSAEPAFAGPLILKSPEVDASKYAGGALSDMMLGPGARWDRAHEIGTPAGPAYVVSGDRGYCISAPDPAAPQPAEERGAACTSTAEFERLGLSIAVGNLYIAAVPQDVPAPTIRTTDGAVRELSPRDGVVVTTVHRGDVLTLTATDGKKRHDRMKLGA